MKKNAFYIVSLLIVAVMVLSACGAPATTKAPAATQPAAATQPPAAAPATLTMWTWKLNHVPGLDAVAKNFEAQTGIKVVVTGVTPDDAYRTKLTTSAQSGDLPDIISYWTGGNDFWNYAGSGVLVELTSKIDDAWKASFIPGTFDKSSVLSQSRYEQCQNEDGCTFKNVKAGQVFSVPYMAGSAYFVYGNKTLMTQAGLDPTKTPANAEEWLDMMKAIKAKTGVAGLTTGVQNPDVSARWLFNPLMMASCGQAKYDAIYDGRDTFLDSCATKVFDFVYSIQQNDLWTADILATDIGPSETAFAAGKAGFVVGGTYTLSGLIANGMSADNVVAFAMPALKGSALSKLSVGVDGLIEAGITRDSKNPDKALEFLKFLTSPEQASVFAKLVGDLPAVKLDADAAKVGGAIAGLIPALDPANAPFGKSNADPYIDEIFNVLRPGLQAFITGEQTPAKLEADIQAASEAGWPNHGGPRPPAQP